MKRKGKKEERSEEGLGGLAKESAPATGNLSERILPWQYPEAFYPSRVPPGSFPQTASGLCVEGARGSSRSTTKVTTVHGHSPQKDHRSDNLLPQSLPSTRPSRTFQNNALSSPTCPPSILGGKGLETCEEQRGHSCKL